MGYHNIDQGANGNLYNIGNFELSNLIYGIDACLKVIIQHALKVLGKYQCLALLRGPTFACTKDLFYING